ncbi:MAG TPA: hypothetical protein VNB90_12825 [Cytophagaceae bacterium]|nr:hypothetical protein [Cytophagaceae bacterium]
MKKIFILFLALFAFQNTIQAQDNKTIILSDTFCVSTQKPKPLVPGMLVGTTCDTLYIINKHRYQLYEQAAKVIRDKKYMSTCDVVIQNYEQRLQAQNIAFEKLYHDYIALDSISQSTITQTKNSLVQVDGKLAGVQDGIGNVDQKIGDIQKTLNAQRRKSFFDKILYGVGGIAVGILGGLIIAH